MRIISKKTLQNYWIDHAEVRGQLEAWLEHVSRAKWTTPGDLQADYGDDVVLSDDRAVFNIKGKKYRLVVHIHYKSQIVHIRFIDTHKKYNLINALTI